MFNLILSATNLFKLSALKFKQEHSWIPEQFKQLQPFKDYPSETLIKEFETFGLKDFRVKVEEDNITATSDFINYLVNYFRRTIDWAIYNKLQEFDNLNISFENKEYVDLQKLRIQVGDLIDLFDRFNFNKEAPSEKLRTDINLEIGKRKFPAGSSIFKIYNYLKEILQKYNINIESYLENTTEFKNYSKRTNDFWIVFSTQIGDLAGIADRGIKICMSLIEAGNPKDLDIYNKCLAGTILSKYIGVIYLTSGSDFFSRGEKMLYRCLVRIVYDSEKKQNILYLDKMYPEKKEKYLELFKNELEKRSLLPVFTYLEFLNKPFLSFKNPEEESYIPKEYSSYKDYMTLERLEDLSDSDAWEDRLVAANGLPKNSPILIKLLNDYDPPVMEAAARRVPLAILKQFMDDAPRDFYSLEKIYKKRKAILNV